MASQRRPERNVQLLLDHLGPISPRAPAHLTAPEANLTDAPILILDVRRLQLLGVFNQASMGQLIWEASPDQGHHAALYSIHDPVLTIHEVTRNGFVAETKTSIEVVRLNTFSGAGLRPWLRCPARTPDGPCGRRAMKLYLTAATPEFKCRSCLGLPKRGLRLCQLSQATIHALSPA